MYHYHGRIRQQPSSSRFPQVVLEATIAQKTAQDQRVRKSKPGGGSEGRCAKRALGTLKQEPEVRIKCETGSLKFPSDHLIKPLENYIFPIFSLKIALWA